MIMGWKSRSRDCVFGAFFGAWLGIVYAYTSHAINQIYLPGIPLAAPDGSLGSYLVRSLLLGALFGAITALPENRLAGVALAGFAASALASGAALVQSWGIDSFSSTLITVFLTFLPMAVFYLPLALIIRFGIDAQHIDPDRPYLWARRIIIPALLTLLAVVVGSLSLYSKDARDAFRYVDQMIKEGLTAPVERLPSPLTDVKDFKTNAVTAYTLSWSDRVNTFYGPRPAESEMSQFLIIARFNNGFSFACVFSANRNVPNCTNY